MLKATSALVLAIVVFSLSYSDASAGNKKCHPYFKIASKVAKKATPKPKLKHTITGKTSSSSDAPWLIADLCHAYQIPQNLSGTGVIGILELGGGWVQSDLDQFCALNNLPPIVVTNVSVDGTQNSPSSPPDLNSADVEVALDIEIAAATYYYATGKMPEIKVFFAENTYEAMEAVINAAVAAKCDVLSISWGADEASWQQDAPGAAQSLEAAAKSAAANGMVILAASGDNSSSDGNTGTNVDVPASCPHILGCGGTTKTVSTETVWGDGVATDYGTGGGFSVIFPKQAFQRGAPKGSGRMVPDISANADPATGYLMVYGGLELQVGGTSAVAPFYAGLLAASGRRLGFISPTLWSHPFAFTDITQGSNGAYSATVGADPCTGLGVPHAGGITGLFSDVGQTFTINVVDRVTGNYQGTLDFNDPELHDFVVTGPRGTGSGTYRQVPPTALISTVIGHSPSSTSIFPGTFYAIIFDLKAIGIPYLFDQTPARIYGTGFGLNASKKFEIYNFSGQN